MTTIIYIDEFTRGSKSVDALQMLLKKMGHTPIIFKGVSGRTMLSMGMVRWARRVILRNISRLAKLPEADIIFLEPSAWSVFRDEAPSLLSNAALSMSNVLSRCFLYDEWLLKHADELTPLLKKPLSHTSILLHEHCHQCALLGPGRTRRLLELIPDTTVIMVGDSCCGMAGVYGYFKVNYELSMTIGKPLFDGINAYPDAIVSAPGISCRKQILDGTGRKVFHPLEIISMNCFGNPK